MVPPDSSPPICCFARAASVCFASSAGFTVACAALGAPPAAGFFQFLSDELEGVVELSKVLNIHKDPIFVISTIWSLANAASRIQGLLWSPTIQPNTCDLSTFG